jgi:uncharacterized membrane protein
MDRTPGQARPAVLAPRWVPWTSTVICALAVLDSAYLTYQHFKGGNFSGCVVNSFINCGAVTNSIYSRFLGLPVAVLGLAWAAGMLVLCSPPAWRAASPWVGRLRMAGSVAGVVMVFYLVYRELFSIGKLCEYCTGVHILTVALFIVIVFGTALAVPADDGDSGLPERGPVSARSAV